MRADENKRLGEFMDAFVSRSGSASEERKAAEAISVSTVTLLILDKMDICNALVMVQSAIDSLEKIRNSASDTIQRMEEATAGFGDIEWKTSRIRRRKDKGSDLANHAEECFEVETPESVWKCNTFYVVVDTLLVSLRNRFENSKSLLQSLSVFSPVNFSSFNVSGSKNSEMSAIPGSSILREIQFGFF